MPYVTCRTCGLTVYSAARFTSIERCPGCGVDLDWRASERVMVNATQRALARRRRTKTRLPPRGQAPAR